MSGDYFQSPKDKVRFALTEAERVYRISRGTLEVPEWVSSGQKAAEWFEQSLRNAKTHDAYLQSVQLSLNSSESARSFSERVRQADLSAKEFAEHFKRQGAQKLAEDAARQLHNVWTDEQKAEFESAALTKFDEAVSEAYRKENSEVEQEPLTVEEPKVVQEPVIQKIEIAPGYGMLHFLGHFCQRNFRENVLGEVHLDAIELYQEALKSGDKTRATIRRYMVYVCMFQTVFGGVLGWIGGKLSFKIGSGD